MELSVRESILAAAVQLFAEYGYHAAPMRDIARITGIQAASIYYHYANKQALLVEIMKRYMQQLNDSLEHILRDEPDPQRRLTATIANHIYLHTTYKSEFFIIDTEIRSLVAENRIYILSLRDQYEAAFQELLQDGMEQGVFCQNDVKVLSYALIAMCTEVAGWFRPNGRFTVQQIIDIYRQFITHGIIQSRGE